jgi:hypothetical protein
VVSTQSTTRYHDRVFFFFFFFLVVIIPAFILIPVTELVAFESFQDAGEKQYREVEKV